MKINLLIFIDPSGSQSEESLSQATGTLHFYMLFESCMFKASFLLQDWFSELQMSSKHQVYSLILQTYEYFLSEKSYLIEVCSILHTSRKWI